MVLCSLEFFSLRSSISFSCLSITLNDVETELKENREKVKILTENNDALNIKVKSLEKKIDKQIYLC